MIIENDWWIERETHAFVIRHGVGGLNASNDHMELRNVIGESEYVQQTNINPCQIW